MKCIISPRKAAAVLIAGFVLTGCAGQGEPEGASAPSASTDQSPGTTRPPVEGTYTGTQSIALDTKSGEVTRVWVSLTCISPGTLSLPDGAQTVCNDGSAETTSTTPHDLSPGQDTIEVTTNDPSVEYKVKIAYEGR